MLLLKRAGLALFGLKFLFSTLEGNQDFKNETLLKLSHLLAAGPIKDQSAADLLGSHLKTPVGACCEASSN